MGRAAGTGSPLFFHCPVARRNRDPWTWDLPDGHTITLTGRTRPFTPSGARGQRSTFTSYEYRCSCGYTGWSSHMDLARLAER